MLTGIRFHNFRVLGDTTLKLSAFTLIVGPNGSGKSTAIRALNPDPAQGRATFSSVMTVGGAVEPTNQASITYVFADGQTYERAWYPDSDRQSQRDQEDVRRFASGVLRRPPAALVLNLNSDAVATPTQVRTEISLRPDGGNLAGVLQSLRDQYPERYAAYVAELCRWLPDFDNLLFQTPQDNFKAIALRTRSGHHVIPAASLSQGTLFAIAMLTVAYLPDPPEVVAIEEPDRGIHPRLLRDVRDALYRLAYPESFDEGRQAVQVIATTHSPYMVDLFRDHPEEVVLSQKVGLHAKLRNLTDQPNWEEIVADSQLGDLWYSGVLGGVPAGS